MAIEIQQYTSKSDTVTRWKNVIVWLLPALLAGSLVSAVYLQAHPYPAFGAGLYFYMAEQVSQHGYWLPATIPNYPEPIPFAYPPLMFYVVALLRDLTNLSMVTISRYLPALATTAYLVPFYLFVRELLGSRRKAGVAAFILALSPPVLQWHLSAGGIVRAPAALFMLSGLYTGLKLFRTRHPKWLIASSGLFAVTILTHPMYTMFFVLSYLWMYLALDRTWTGLRNGSIVGLSGVVLTAPWWGVVSETHGIDVFTGAAGTHGGLISQILHLAVAFVPELVYDISPKLLIQSRSSELFGVRPWMLDIGAVGLLLLTAWLVLIIGAGVSLVSVDELRSSRKTVFLLGWLFLSFLIAATQPRFQFLIGAIVLSVAIYEYLIPLATRLVAGPVDRRIDRRHLELAVLLVVVVSCLSIGGLYAASALDSHGGSSSLPAFIGDDDVEAMDWAAANTAPSSQFVVMGDAAEWFPPFTHRQILVGPWGIEWKGNEAYNQHLQQYIELSTCPREKCLTRTLEGMSGQPDYVYVPTDTYTVRGMETTISPEMQSELLQSPDYTLVFENDGVMLFRVTTGPSDSLSTGTKGPVTERALSSISPA